MEPLSPIKGLESLESLALDLIWSWSHRADNVWQYLDPVLWELTRNPWVVLQTVSKEKLESALKNSEFLARVEQQLEQNRQDVKADAWFQKEHANSGLSSVAYFCMEFMLSEALPIYSGGLGNVAGDQLKAASDLGVPVSAVSLLYQRGYFRQMLDKEGRQQAIYPYNDPGQLPIQPLRKPNGEWLRLEVALPGWSVWLRAWQAKVGRVNLYLLDSNDAANYPAHRGITSELYGGDSELRLKQELILGIGGWRLLKELGIQPEVCHLNEGHAAFAILERARDFMNNKKIPFFEALAATRAGNIFTTHTAVPAGFDRFSPSLIGQYLDKHVQERFKIQLHELLALGRLNPDDANEPFNMAYLAIRGSGAINGVSQLHGQVSRKIFAPLFSRWPEKEIPIGYVTNGVHMPSWDCPAADRLWTEVCGKCRWRESTDILEKGILEVTNARIWNMRNEARKSFVEFARKRIERIWIARGENPHDIEKAKNFFDPNILIIGFARRFATYKRPNMLLHNPARLTRILTNKERPVQLVIAGKAHPADQPGQALIQQWVKFIRSPEVRSRAVFFSDYDMLLTEQLVGGVDLWINTPRRPWEACGTSGMKVLVNGGLNISELDGWWAEAYNPDVGWAIGDGKEHGDDPAWDAAEAERLYDLLEQQIIPEFYTRDKEAIPLEWTNRIKKSMSRLTPRYSAHRTVKQYTEEYYIPAAVKYREREQNRDNFWRSATEWRKTIEEGWNFIHFGPFKVDQSGSKNVFEMQICLGRIAPESIRVELYAENTNGSSEIHSMEKLRKLETPDTYLYRAEIPSTLPASFYTPRIVPFNESLEIPLEESKILWQK
jgi:starch phosphorylase